MGNTSRVSHLVKMKQDCYNILCHLGSWTLSTLTEWKREGKYPSKLPERVAWVIKFKSGQWSVLPSNLHNYSLNIRKQHKLFHTKAWDATHMKATGFWRFYLFILICRFNPLHPYFRLTSSFSIFIFWLNLAFWIDLNWFLFSCPCWLHPYWERYFKFLCMEHSGKESENRCEHNY